MNRVRDGLYVGSLKEAGDRERIERKGFTAINKLTHKEPPIPYPKTVDVVQTPMIDRNIGKRENFEEGVRGVLHSLENGEKAFVHCSAGVSRTPITTATALAIHDEIELDEALEDVRDAMRGDHTDPAAADGGSTDPTEIHPKLREYAEDMLGKPPSEQIPDDYEPPSR